MDGKTFNNSSIMNVQDLQIHIIKEEPSDLNEEYTIESSDYSASVNEFESIGAINEDIVTYLDVTLENNSDDEELYDSDLEQLPFDEDTHHNLAFTCEICKKGFRTYRSLQVHSAIHTQNGFKNKSTCTICHKKFDARKLTYHFRQHKVARTYQCYYCDTSYFTQAHLDEHIRSHAGYSCNKCSISFEKEADLKNHYKSHVEDFMYACSICDETFSTITDLSHHITTHKRKRKLSSFS